MRTFGLLSLILALVIVGGCWLETVGATHQTAPIAASQAASSAGIGSPVWGRRRAPNCKIRSKTMSNKVMQDRASQQVNQGLRGSRQKP